MDTDRNGSQEAQIAAYGFAFLFLAMLGLMAASEANTRPGNPPSIKLGVFPSQQA